MPLISSSLCAIDCDVLLEKITGRINSWLSHYLSLLGGCNLFILFSKVYKSIKVVFSSYQRKLLKLLNKNSIDFFWNDKDDGIARAKVVGNMLCLPKKECGLGIKKLEEWNRAALIWHIWSLFVKVGSLWVA